MAIVNSVATVGPAYGSGYLTQRTGITVSSGTTYSLPSTGSVNGNPIYRGKVRVKIYNGAGTSPTLTKLQVSITDGTNTVIIGDLNFGTAVTLSTTNWFDGEFLFLVDYSTAGGGATGTLLGPGTTAAVVVQVVPTLGGTSPAATMDIEVVGEP